MKTSHLCTVHICIFFLYTRFCYFFIILFYFFGHCTCRYSLYLPSTISNNRAHDSTSLFSKKRNENNRLNTTFCSFCKKKETKKKKEKHNLYQKKLSSTRITHTNFLGKRVFPHFPKTAASIGGTSHWLAKRVREGESKGPGPPLRGAFALRCVALGGVDGVGAISLTPSLPTAHRPLHAAHCTRHSSAPAPTTACQRASQSRCDPVFPTATFWALHQRISASMCSVLPKAIAIEPLSCRVTEWLRLDFSF